MIFIKCINAKDYPSGLIQQGMIYRAEEHESDDNFYKLYFTDNQEGIFTVYKDNFEEVDKSMYVDYPLKKLKNTCLVIGMEEASELQKAISKMYRGKGNRSNLVEEMADVLICMDWLMEKYKISEEELIHMKNYKISKILNKIDQGKFK